MGRIRKCRFLAEVSVLVLVVSIGTERSGASKMSQIQIYPLARCPVFQIYVEIKKSIESATTTPCKAYSLSLYSIQLSKIDSTYFDRLHKILYDTNNQVS